MRFLVTAASREVASIMVRLLLLAAVALVLGLGWAPTAEAASPVTFFTSPAAGFLVGAGPSAMT